jgi:hypothetical protein
MDPASIKKGDVLRYHPVIGVATYIRVRVMAEPWELASGDWICKARGLADERVYRPCLEALERDS